MKDYVMELEHIENSLVDRVDGKKLMDYTSNIAKWVRISGTQEEVDSLLYCEKVMKEIGYETKLTFHDAFISVPVRAHVEMVSPVPMGFRALTHCFTRSAPEHGLEGGAVDSDSPDINGPIAIKDGLPNADQVRDMEKEGLWLSFMCRMTIYIIRRYPLFGAVPQRKRKGCFQAFRWCPWSGRTAPLFGIR
ncbi:MAG: hypothetical protein ACLSFC_20400 [Enterocloster bolteae]